MRYFLCALLLVCVGCGSPKVSPPSGIYPSSPNPGTNQTFLVFTNNPGEKTLRLLKDANFTPVVNTSLIWDATGRDFTLKATLDAIVNAHEHGGYFTNRP
jgi:hypothetical protein